MAAYILGNLIGTLVRTYILTRITGLIIRKIGVDRKYQLVCTYILYILVFWPFAYLINDPAKATSFVLWDIPILLLWSAIDFFRIRKQSQG